jgi:hypothetical protein
MDYFSSSITGAVDLFQIDMNIMGITFSFWEVFLFFSVVSLIIWFIRRFFN